MSKRRESTAANLPLFDLPLQSPEEDGGAGSATLDSPAPAPEPLPESPRPESPPKSRPKPPAASVSPPADLPMPAEPMQPPLFSREELAGPPAETAAAEETAVSADAPLIQDRLLSGLADLVLLAAAVGSMVLATQTIGVRVALEDWPPFVLLGLLISFPYTVVPLAFWGQTPGMAWVGHVARSTAGEPLTFGQTARRWAGALATVALAGVPLLLALRGRSLADRLSDSKTLQRP